MLGGVDSGGIVDGAGCKFGVAGNGEVPCGSNPGDVRGCKFGGVFSGGAVNWFGIGVIMFGGATSPGGSAKPPDCIATCRTLP
jgi:hypothetical protein